MSVSSASRAALGFRWAEDAFADLRYAVRSLWKDRIFAVTAFLTLGVGVAATIAMFAVVDAILIRPLPFPASDRLVGLHERHPQRGWMAITPANLRDIQQEISAFALIGAVQGGQANLALGTGAQSVAVGQLGMDLFGTLGVSPRLGRAFGPRDFEPGAAPVAVISHALWQQAWGGSPTVVGMTLRLGGDPYTVTGVMPPQFSLFGDVAVWTPWQGPADAVRAGQSLGSAWQDRQFHHFIGVARLREGVSLDDARAQLRTLAQRLAVDYPVTNTNWTFELTTLDGMILGTHVRPMLLILMGAASFVLVIGCVNVANLLLARASRRQREIAVRVALGCGRSRLMRQLLVESGVLVAGGMAAGLVLTAGSVPLVRHIPLTTDLAFFPDLHPDRSIGLAVFAIFFVATLAAGLVPAWRASDASLIGLSLIRRVGRAPRRTTHARQALTVGEIALTVMLLAGAGVLLRSFDRLAHLELGLTPDHVLTAQVTLDETSYQTPTARAAYFQRVLDRVQSLPGVIAAATANYTPITRPGFNLRFAIEGRPPTETGDVTTAPLAAVSPSFFVTLRIPLIRGRLFDVRDTETAPLALLVNAAFAHHFFGSDDPIGHRIRLAAMGDWRTVVGVVGDVRSAVLEEGPEATMYAPLAQEPREDTILVRTSHDPASEAHAVRDAISTLDPQQAVSQVHPFDEVVAEATAPSRFRASVVSLFAVLALVLAAVGVYGVVSYTIAQRTMEWGIRLALGVDPRRLVVTIMGQQLGSVLLGIGVGLLGCVALAHLMGGFVFGVSSLDPISLGAAVPTVLIVAMLASYIPARRVTNIDPLVALRCE